MKHFGPDSGTGKGKSKGGRGVEATKGYTSVDQKQHTSFITNVDIGQHAEFREINSSYHQNSMCVDVCIMCRYHI